MSDSIERDVKDFILREFLPGADADEVTPDTELITAGILDSLATLRLVAFLEETFGITLEAYEASADHLNTVTQIGELVRSKRG